jgi:hypothetical protein
VKTLWTPALTEKQALAICGSLSNPSKMPGHGYALPAYRCRLGSFLQHPPRAHLLRLLRVAWQIPVSKREGGNGEALRKS